MFTRVFQKAWTFYLRTTDDDKSPVPLIKRNIRPAVCQQKPHTRPQKREIPSWQMHIQVNKRNSGSGEFIAIHILSCTRFDHVNHPATPRKLYVSASPLYAYLNESFYSLVSPSITPSLFHSDLKMIPFRQILSTNDDPRSLTIDTLDRLPRLVGPFPVYGSF